MVRHFDRFYTKQIDVLSEGLLESPFSLTEARVIDELAQCGSAIASKRENDWLMNAHGLPVKLVTSVLLAAHDIYEKAGYRLVKAEKHHSFGHDLIGETWELDLSRGFRRIESGFYPCHSRLLIRVVEIAVRRPSY